jgi:hypothetical protein
MPVASKLTVARSISFPLTRTDPALKSHPDAGTYESRATHDPIEQAEYARTVMKSKHQFQILIFRVRESDFWPKVMQELGRLPIPVTPFLEMRYIRKQAYASVGGDHRIDLGVPWQSIIAQIERRPSLAQTLIAKSD